jgi:hypothetical protein
MWPIVNAVALCFFVGSAGIFLWRLDVFLAGDRWVKLTLLATLLSTAFFAFTRVALRIDRAGRRIRKYWGPHCFFADYPVWTSDHPFDAVSQVVYTQEIQEMHSRRGGKKYHTVFPVRLVGPGVEILAGDYPTEGAARSAGESMARMLGKPLSNSTGARPSIRSPEDLDLSLRDRILQGGRPLVPPEPPARLRPGLRTSHDAVTLHLPANPPGALAIAALGAALAAIACIGWVYPALRLLAPVCLVLALLWWLLRLVRERVVISRSRVTRWRGLGIGWTRSIEVPELEEAVSARTRLPFWGWHSDRTHPVLRVVSDRRTLEIGRGLSEEEIDYLRDLTRYLISS